MSNQDQQKQIIFREATEEDYPAVIAMYYKLDNHFRKFTYAFPIVENIGEKWFASFQRTLGRFSFLYVAEYQNEIVGFITARIKRVPDFFGGVMVGELKDMWIEPKVRRLGIGETLLQYAIEWCREQDVYSLEAQILIGNEPIKKMFKNIGMEPELYQLRMNLDDFNEINPQE